MINAVYQLIGRNELINRVNHRLHPLLAAFEPLLGRMDR